MTVAARAIGRGKRLASVFQFTVCISFTISNSETFVASQAANILEKA